MQHILFTPKTSVRTVRPSPRNCPIMFFVRFSGVFLSSHGTCCSLSFFLVFFLSCLCWVMPCLCSVELIIHYSLGISHLYHGWAVSLFLVTGMIGLELVHYVTPFIIWLSRLLLLTHTLFALWANHNSWLDMSQVWLGCSLVPGYRAPLTEHVDYVTPFSDCRRLS